MLLAGIALNRTPGSNTPYRHQKEGLKKSHREKLKSGWLISTEFFHSYWKIILHKNKLFYRKYLQQASTKKEQCLFYLCKSSMQFSKLFCNIFFQHDITKLLWSTMFKKVTVSARVAAREETDFHYENKYITHLGIFMCKERLIKLGLWDWVCEMQMYSWTADKSVFEMCGFPLTVLPVFCTGITIIQLDTVQVVACMWCECELLLGENTFL